MVLFANLAAEPPIVDPCSLKRYTCAAPFYHLLEGEVATGKQFANGRGATDSLNSYSSTTLSPLIDV